MRGLWTAGLFATAVMMTGSALAGAYLLLMQPDRLPLRVIEIKGEFRQLDRATIERTIEELNAAKNGDDTARIRQLTEQLQQASYAIGQQAYAAQQAAGQQPGQGPGGQGPGGQGPAGGSGPEDIIDGDFSEA